MGTESAEWARGLAVLLAQGSATVRAVLPACAFVSNFFLLDAVSTSSPWRSRRPSISWPPQAYSSAGPWDRRCPAHVLRHELGRGRWSLPLCGADVLRIPAWDKAQVALVLRRKSRPVSPSSMSSFSPLMLLATTVFSIDIASSGFSGVTISVIRIRGAVDHYVHDSVILHYSACGTFPVNITRRSRFQTLRLNVCQFVSFIPVPDEQQPRSGRAFRMFGTPRSKTSRPSNLKNLPDEPDDSPAVRRQRGPPAQESGPTRPTCPCRRRSGRPRRCWASTPRLMISFFQTLADGDDRVALPRALLRTTG